jgi:hypothetical protein
MSSIFDTIANYSNDIEVDYREETYVEPKAPGFKLIPPGNYRISIAAADVNQRVRNGVGVESEGWPTLVVEKFTILAPENLEGRKVIAYADIRTKPFPRDGCAASDLLDWVRAYDASATGLGSRNGQLQALAGFLQDEAPLTIRLDWEAFDKSYIDEVKLTGTPTNEDYKKARLRGTKGFDEFGQGVSPYTGKPLKAQYRIAQFYSSLTAKDVKLAKP